MKLWSVMGNSQKLDGGAMFGNAPRAMWAKWSPPDAENRIELACRALLASPLNGKTVLFEAGIGAFFEPRLRERYGVSEDRHVLVDSLAAAGFTPDDIDVVVLSHLHFDHAGGVLASWEQGQSPRLLFPHATYVVGRAHYQRAVQPHARDRASFIAELPALLEATGRLELVDGAHCQTLGDAVRFHYSDGHTPGLMLAEIVGPERVDPERTDPEPADHERADPERGDPERGDPERGDPERGDPARVDSERADAAGGEAHGGVVFCADLIPGRPWVHVPITMGYDRNAELLIDEKQAFLADKLARNVHLFFTHDPGCALAQVVRDGKGKFSTAHEVAQLHARPLSAAERRA